MSASPSLQALHQSSRLLGIDEAGGIQAGLELQQKVFDFFVRGRRRPRGLRQPAAQRAHTQFVGKHLHSLGKVKRRIVFAGGYRGKQPALNRLRYRQAVTFRAKNNCHLTMVRFGEQPRAGDAAIQRLVGKIPCAYGRGHRQHGALQVEQVGIVDHGAQPMAMFRYACHRQGLDVRDAILVDAGTTERMVDAFKKGDGDYVHLQGPGPQQIEHDGAGHIVAALGDAIGPCAFSSLAATREWLATDMAKSFMRAYRKARAWLIATPAAEVAKAEAAYFKDIDSAVLATTIAAYQKLGNWSPHVEITRPAFEATLDIFQHAGLITKRHKYEDVVAQPPAE